MDVELWIFITAGLLFAFCAGAIVGCVATRWAVGQEVEAAGKLHAAWDGSAVREDLAEVGPVTGDTRPDEDEWAMARMVGMVEPDDRRDGLSRSIDERWDAAVGTTACNPVVVWAGTNWTVSCTCGHQDDSYDTAQAAHDAMSRHLDARQGVE